MSTFARLEWDVHSMSACTPLHQLVEVKPSRAKSLVRYANTREKLRTFCDDRECATAEDCEEVSTSTIRHSYYLTHSEVPSASRFQSFEVAAAPVTNMERFSVSFRITSYKDRTHKSSLEFSLHMSTHLRALPKSSSDSFQNQRLSTNLAHCDRMYPREPEPVIKITISALEILRISSSGSCMSQRIFGLTTIDRLDRQGFSTARELDSDEAKAQGLPPGPTSVVAPTTTGCSSRVPSPRAAPLRLAVRRPLAPPHSPICYRPWSPVMGRCCNAVSSGPLCKPLHGRIAGYRMTPASSTQESRTGRTDQQAPGTTKVITTWNRKAGKPGHPQATASTELPSSPQRKVLHAAIGRCPCQDHPRPTTLAWWGGAVPTRNKPGVAAHQVE